MSISIAIRSVSVICTSSLEKICGGWGEEGRKRRRGKGRGERREGREKRGQRGEERDRL